MSVSESSSSSISFDDTSSGRSNPHGNDPKGEDEASGNVEIKRIHAIAKNETRHIRLWRVVVIVSLLVAGATVSAFTHLFLRWG